MHVQIGVMIPFPKALFRHCSLFPKVCRLALDNARLGGFSIRHNQQLTSVKDPVTAQIGLLIRVFKFTEKEAGSIIAKRKRAKILTKDHVYSIAAALKQLNVPAQGILSAPELLSLSAMAIWNRGRLFQDYGWTTLTATHLKGFGKYLTIPISLLHRHGASFSSGNLVETVLQNISAPNPLKHTIRYALKASLSEQLDVQQPVFSDSTMQSQIMDKSNTVPISDYATNETATGKKQMAADEEFGEHVFPLEDVDKFTIEEIQKVVINELLLFHLGAKEELADTIRRTYHSLRLRSPSDLQATILMLFNIGMDAEKILDHSNILEADASNVEKVIGLDQIAGFSSMAAISLCPKLVTVPANVIQSVEGVLLKAGFPMGAIQKRLSVLTLPVEKIVERVGVLRTMPDFHIMATSPNSIDLVYHHEKALTRMNSLKVINHPRVSVKLLVSSDDYFDTAVLTGKGSSASDITNYLSTSLQIPPPVIKQKLKMHPQWHRVPFTQVNETLSYLTEMGFSREQLINGLHLLLYPKQLVRLYLSVMLGDGGVSVDELLPKMEHFFNSIEGDDIVAKMEVIRGEVIQACGHDVMSHANVLQLCMYYIELTSQFSGDGVWIDSPPDESHQHMPP